MNKVCKCLVLMLGLLIVFTVNANAVNAATLTKTKSGYYYDRARGDGSDRHSWYFMQYEMDGEVSYCIEPNIPEGVVYDPGSWEATGLPNSIKERILLIGYYGYTYPGHQTLQYRAATQGMIWDTIVGYGAVTNFSTERYGAGTPFNVSNEKAEIERLISTHYIKPSFDGGVFKTQKGQTITLTDTNNVLGNYNVSVSEADYQVNGNTLTITPTTDGAINVSLVKNMPYASAYKLFVGDGIQNMFVPGTTDPVRAKIRVNSYATPVEVYKRDNETGTAQGQATLRGAEYGVYESATGRLVTTVVTDENGYFKSDSVLEYKDYYLQEIRPSEGYKLDKTRYNIDVRGKESARVDVTEQVIKNYISILKQYEYVNGDTKFLNAEAGITFEIYYPNGTKFDEITTDRNGYASINMPYGIWKFHQKNTTTGYEKIYDFYITVSETSKTEQYYNILNNALNAYLQVIKVDEESRRTIAIADTTFKIFNEDTRQYVSQYVSGKVLSEYKTDENGILVTPLKLEAGNYKLIEVSAPNGYLKDKDGLRFTIGNGTYYNYTTYGAYITVTYNNAPIKGQVEIHKTGENFIIKDGKYTYGKKNLSGVIFEIYAEEDILTADKNHLYYNKGDLVNVLTTDENGYAKSKKLPLGKYYLIEVNTQEDYVLDSNKHYFTLKQIDDETPIVYESYSALNYLKKATIEFTKIDLINGDVIPNTIVEIYTENNELIYTGKTDESGKITITDLKVGRYYIVEKEPSTGYVLTTEKVYFEMKENGEVVKAEMKNRPIMGKLEFTKTDISTGEPLPNTLIEIYNEKDKLVFSDRTDEDGKIITPELRYGKYYILEKEAPEGYTLNSEKVSFEIKEDGEIVKAEMTDKPITGTLEFTKIDVSTGEPLPNTLIEIYNEKDELVFSGRTDENGKITIPELRYGKYYILEKEAPEGYILNTEKMYFEIKEDGEVVKATMTNEKIVIDVPITGTNYLYIIEIIGSLLILGGIGVVIYVKKKK